MTPTEIEDLKRTKGFILLQVHFRDVRRPARTLEVRDEQEILADGHADYPVLGPIRTLDGTLHLLAWDAIEEATIERRPPSVVPVCDVEGCGLPSGHPGDQRHGLQPGGLALG